MLYRDPSGKFVWVIAGALVGAATNLLIEASINGGNLTGDQVAAALVSGAISGAIGSLAGPVGGTVARALTGRATGLLARLGVAAFSAGGGYAGQVAANGIDPCHTADPLVAAAFGGVGGFLGSLFPTKTLNTIAQANHFAPTSIEGLFNSNNSVNYWGALFTSSFAGAGANYE